MIQTNRKSTILPRRTLAGFCSLLALGGLAAPSTLAQQGEDAQARPGLEEIVVTARRREENLATVPIAISALGGEEILKRSIRTDSDLQAAVPGLTIRQTQGNNSLTYSIRGQSADTFSGSPSAVVAYMNEVPLSISGASTFYDLESIQVLKGPQGTLFGRNTTGGAVLYTAAKPTAEQEGLLRVRTGNLDLTEVEGMLNIPLSDTVLLRGAFNTIDRDGYIDNLYTGKEHGEVGRDSGRLSLSLQPSDRLENTSVFAYSESEGTNTGASYTYSVYGPGQTNNGFALNSSAGFLYGPLMDVAFGFAGAWDGYLAAHPKAYAPGLIAYVEEQKRLGHYITQHPGDAVHEGKDWIFTNTTTFDISPDLQLKNIFGASHAETDSEQPALGAPYIVFVTQNLATGKSGNETEVDSISNEIQLSGATADDTFNYITGLYLQREESETLWPQTYFELAPWAPPVTATNNFGIDTDTVAIYAQGTYSLSERLRLTAGGRYTWEDVTIKQLAASDYLGVPGFEQEQDESFEEPSWEVGLEYDFSDTLFTYLKARGSFRSGGFNGSAPPVNADATGGGNKFAIESVRDVEAGLKYAGLFLDRPAAFNLAIYQQWVEDVQRIEFPDPPGPVASIAVTANVPEMEVKGLELEMSFMPSDWLELGIAGAYTDAEFTDGEATLFGVQYSYSPVANTPETTWSVWGRLDVPIDPAAGEMSLRADIYGQDSMYFSNTADSIGFDTKLPSYELINARLDWSNVMGSGFSTALFGRNLADEEHFVGGMALGASLGHNAAAVGEPRTYGLEISYGF